MTADDARSDLRPGRNARRRRKRLAALTATAVVVAVILGSGAAWAFDLFGADDGPTALARRATTTTTRRSSPAELRPAGPCERRLTPDDPLRLWIAGDSLAGSLGPSLGKTTGATGVVQPVYDSRVSSGLGSPDFFDWPRHATEEMERLDPEVVVFIIGANDWRFPTPKPTDASGQPEWRAEYELLVTKMLDAFDAGGSSAGRRLVYWVGSPTMQDKDKDAGVKAVNDVARAVIAKHPRARYIDAYKVFSDEDGKFTATIRGEDGESVRIRAGDGVHLTPDGGDLLATSVYAPIDARCDLDGQAVPGKAKQAIKTKGSGESPGGTGSGSGTSGSQSGTPPTAAPAVGQPSGGGTPPATTPKTSGTSPQTSPPPPPPPPPPDTTPGTTPTTPDTGSPSGSTPTS